MVRRSSAELATLHAPDGSLVLELIGNGPPLWRHFGARTDPAGLAPLADERSASSFSLDADQPFSTAPRAGLGWFGPAAVEVARDGDALPLVFDGCEVREDGASLRVLLTDSQARVALRQTFEVDGAIFRCRAELSNLDAGPLDVVWLASALLPLPPAEMLVSYRGRHNAELAECREPVPAQQWRRESRGGISGHGGPPGVYVLGEGATRHAGLVVAAQLAWSGEAILSVECDGAGGHLLSAGMRLRPGECRLGDGETLTAPDLLVAVSTAGRNGASQAFHAAIRRGVSWPGGTMRPRPVHLNSWEACYFDHDEARIGELAEAAAALGVERFVLDDGWFSGRDNDTRALGDWVPDKRKYPNGLKALADKVCGLGMEFGLWVEPEMVNPDSDLYRAHPDWTLALADRERPTARNQLVLDMRRDDVGDHLFSVLHELLREAPIGYLKWDHNRLLAPAGGAEHIAGTYRLLARLREAHPQVEIEGCAGGGGRSDAGLARYVHRFWTSDNLDAVSRVAIQRGFLAFLPPEMMGAHVGAAPAHATGRSQSLDFRAAIAVGGHFGLELDPRMLDQRERARLAEWIAFYKAWRGILHQGRIWLGEESDGLVWQAQGSPERFVLTAIRVEPSQRSALRPVRLPFVSGDARYSVRLVERAGRLRDARRKLPPLFGAPAHFSGAWLAVAGLPLPPLGAESAAIFAIEATP